MSAAGDQQQRDGVSADQAGTPLVSPGGPASAEPLPGLAEVLEILEFPAVLDTIAGFAAGSTGAESVRARRPTGDAEWISAELARVAEVAALFRRGDGLAAHAVPDLSRALGRLRLEGSLLEASELAAIAVGLSAARAVEAELRRVASQAPRAAALIVPLPDRRIERRLEQSVDPDGALLDTASPALAAARREVQTARERLVRRLEGILRGLDGGGAVTVRNGRYVIPVRRDSRGRPDGIIHDESASGETLFIEPSAAVELGNALREAQTGEEREVVRVLRELTDLLRPEHATIRAATAMAVAVDDLVARSRWAVANGGEAPLTAPAPAPLRIVQGRHPLLLAQGGRVVPFDLTLDDDERTLLISGPNTGGKTVLLKTVALACALAQSGIVPPVAAESSLPIFRQFFADIGDRQSISASLSTFSAHVAMLRRVLDEADDTALVLLDEIGSGTDPVEGAALASATLAALTRRGTVTLATTHLGSLKSLATAEAGVVNGSLQFDTATLTPTYLFQKGVPGRSYGLAIARRLGVRPDILTDAEARVPEVERDLDALLASAEARHQQLEREARAQAERAVELEGLAARLGIQERDQAAREAELQRREKDAERDGRRQARQYLLEARRQVEEALGRARGAADLAEARDARRLVEEAIQREGEALAETEEEREQPTVLTRAPGTLEPGHPVRVRGMTGRVEEQRTDGTVAVVLGSMRLVVSATEVEPIAEPARKNRPAPAPAEPVSAGAPFEIDLRGLTGDEAEAAALAAIDAAVLAEQPFLRIIHGMGTGVVRERVRRVAGADRRVARFEFAPRNQGGTGVTVLEFRS